MCYFGLLSHEEQTRRFLPYTKQLLLGIGFDMGILGESPGTGFQNMQVQPTAMVSMTVRCRQGPERGGSGQRRRRTGTWLNTGTLTMLRSSCMVKGFTQPRHRHRASGRSAGIRLGSWLILCKGRAQRRWSRWSPTEGACIPTPCLSQEHGRGRQCPAVLCRIVPSPVGVECPLSYHPRPPLPLTQASLPQVMQRIEVHVPAEKAEGLLKSKSLPQG